MKQFIISLAALLISNMCLGKGPDYDSLVVEFGYDKAVSDSPNKYTTVPVTPQMEYIRATLSPKEARRFNRKLYRRCSYGESQGLPPQYDFRIIYYRNGMKTEEVNVNLWTSRLFASMPLEVQRQGICMCEGTGGYCCSEGGISKGFKSFLIGLLENHNIPVEREDIMSFGK